MFHDHNTHTVTTCAPTANSTYSIIEIIIFAGATEKKNYIRIICLGATNAATNWESGKREGDHAVVMCLLTIYRLVSVPSRTERATTNIS